MWVYVLAWALGASLVVGFVAVSLRGGIKPFIPAILGLLGLVLLVVSWEAGVQALPHGVRIDTAPTRHE
ncbi:MAG TPA: hypothetical protein VEI06_07600 [Gemmatimonadaceae bacterium]|nr:hypothetical protein [Gemmatimonadaceae bacterium]